MRSVREALFALRVVRRRGGNAAIVYRRTLNRNKEERLARVAAIGPLAFTAGLLLLRVAARGSEGRKTKLEPGPYIALSPDWGVRVACYALVVRGLRNADRMYRAANHLRDADPTEAAWWFAVMTGRGGKRGVRALRVLTEAVR